MIGREGDEPHVMFGRRDGSDSPIYDCKRVGFGGGPPGSVQRGTAIVKWLWDGENNETVPPDHAHQEWQVEQETNGWALARDPWDKRLHWLTRDSEYRLQVGGNDGYNTVTMQTLLV